MSSASILPSNPSTQEEMGGPLDGVFHMLACKQLNQYVKKHRTKIKKALKKHWDKDHGMWTIVNDRNAFPFDLYAERFKMTEDMDSLGLIISSIPSDSEEETEECEDKIIQLILETPRKKQESKETR